MVFDHTELANELSAAAHRFGVSMPAGVSQQAEETENKLESEHGASFDRAYMAAQVKAHEKAIGLFDKEAKAATNGEVAQLANLSLAILDQHLDLARLIDNALGNQAQASQSNRAEPSRP
jgi:putative membrane protein